jgi:hypothetical protein
MKLFEKVRHRILRNGHSPTAVVGCQIRPFYACTDPIRMP